MSRGGRSPAAMLLALVGVVVLGVAGSMSSIVQLSAVVTALVMGGNTNPDPSTEYVDSLIDNYYDASFTGVRRGIHTPEEFWPNNGTLTFDQSTAEGVDDLEHEMDTTDGELVIVGYSASTRIASARSTNSSPRATTAATSRSCSSPTSTRATVASWRGSAAGPSRSSA